MNRTIQSITFLSAVLVLASAAVSSETVNETCTKAGQCEKGACTEDACKATPCQVLTSTSDACTGDTCTSDACTGDVCTGKSCVGDACESKGCEGNTCTAKSCESAAARLIHLSVSPDSEPASSTQCDACTADNLVTANDPCKSCSDCPTTCTSSASTAIKTTTDCQSETACSYCAETDQSCRHSIAVLHSQLIAERTKNAVLVAKLEFQQELAQSREEFTSRVLEKEVEVAHLHAELQISNERTKIGRELGEAVVAYERIKASLELAQDRNEQLEIAQRESHQAESLAASKANNARLLERIADLEARLQSIDARLAKQPTDVQVK